MDETTIQNKIQELGRRLSVDYADLNPLVVGVLKGSFIFMADLVRALTIPLELDFLAVSSYGMSAASSGAVRILKDLDTNIKGRHVVIVEDILDSGITLRYIIDLMEARKPASMAVCVLLDKPDRRQLPLSVQYTGFQIPDEFAVGYGLDYAQRYRNLPYVGVLKRSVYNHG